MLRVRLPALLLTLPVMRWMPLLTRPPMLPMRLPMPPLALPMPPPMPPLAPPTRLLVPPLTPAPLQKPLVKLLPTLPRPRRLPD